MIPETVALLGIDIRFIDVTWLEGLIPMMLFTFKASMLIYVFFPSFNVHVMKAVFLTLLCGFGDRQRQQNLQNVRRR